ncbi:MAG: hypothetical protein GX309_12285 [Clostridiales bacterium]|nr:hypothetical protein [Clostridiales bacterium]
MQPYSKKYIKEIIDKYLNIISENEIGNYKIVKKSSINRKGYLYESPEEYKFKEIVLMENDKIIMKLNNYEIEGTYETIRMAKGKVGIVGLGIGYSVIEIASKKEVSEVIVYEKISEVIEMFKKNFFEVKSMKKILSKIKIVNCDAFKAEKDKFDYFFVDIYGYELDSQVVEDYKRFNDIHDIGEYSFFGVEDFLLSCSYNEIVWVYIPENWMAMSKSIASSLESSGYIKYYKKLDEKLVSNVLSKFKEVLNE